MVYFDVAQAQIRRTARPSSTARWRFSTPTPRCDFDHQPVTTRIGSVQRGAGERRPLVVEKYHREGDRRHPAGPGVNGEKDPVDSGSDEAAWAQNRRAVSS
jgi:hypothetical protein